MKILVACDGSKPALRAVKYAADLVNGLSSGGSITLISVHDAVAFRHASRFVGKDAINEYLRDLSEKDLAAARRALDKAGVKHDMVMRTGHVASEISQAASRGKFDMIVLGAKGRSALRDLLIGSIAKQVSEVATVPVLLVK